MKITRCLAVAMMLNLLGSNQSKALTINCLEQTTQTQRQAICKSVVEPVKFRNGEYATVDCTVKPADGTISSVCQKVNLREQRRMRRRHSKQVR